MLDLPVETQCVWPSSSIEHTLWDGGVASLFLMKTLSNYQWKKIKDQGLTTTVICQVETGRKDPLSQSVCWSCSWMFEFEYWVLQESFSWILHPSISLCSEETGTGLRQVFLHSYTSLEQHLQKTRAWQFSHKSFLIYFFSLQYKRCLKMASFQSICNCYLFDDSGRSHWGISNKWFYPCPWERHRDRDRVREREKERSIRIMS